MKGYWFVMQGYTAHLIVAANCEAAVAKFNHQHPGQVPLFRCAATICPECYKYTAPIDRDVQKLHYPGAEPCNCGHQHTTHFLGDAVNTIANPLSPAQIN